MPAVLGADAHAFAESEPARAVPVPRRGWLAPLVALLLLCQTAFCWYGRTRSLHGVVDLRVFYASGRMVLAHGAAHLYDLEAQRRVQQAIFADGGRTLPFLYPACVAPLFAPLALLSYKLAFAVWLLGNLLLLSLSVLLLRGVSAQLRRLPALLTVGAALCLFPVSMALMQGQVTFLLLLVLVLTQILLQKGQPFLAGAVLALALIKFQIALPIALLFLLWKQWRMCAGFGVGAALVSGVSLAVAGPGGLRAYWQEISGITATTLNDPAKAHAAYGMAASEMPNLHGLCSKLTHGASAGQVLCGLLSLALLAWVARGRPNLSVGLCAAMLVSYHMQAYDLVLLILPLLMVVEEWLRREAEDATTSAAAGVPLAWYGMAVLPLIVPVAPVLLVTHWSAAGVVAVVGCMRLSREAAVRPQVQDRRPLVAASATTA